MTTLLVYMRRTKRTEPHLCPPVSLPGEDHGLLITLTCFNLPQVTIWTFTLSLDFLSSFVLFAVDIPCVLFVFIYDYLQKKRMA